MLSLVLAVILSLMARTTDAATSVTECPRDCTCKTTIDDLTVDCGGRGVSDQLSRQLDTLLSTDHIMERLTSLTIANTPLTHVPQSVCRLMNLTLLHLDQNRLTELPDNCISSLTKLKAFSASRNAIVGLNDGVFDRLQNLVTLNLSQNQIAFIGLRVFSNATDLTSLRSIDLNFNKLTSLEPWWYYRCVVVSGWPGVYVLLRHNLIANFTNNILDYKCGMKQPYGFVDLYDNRIKHVMDIVRGWNIELNEWWCISSVRHYPGIRFGFGGNSYDCDCTDFYFYSFNNFLPRTAILDKVRCHGLRLATSVPLNEFICELSDRCPSGCRCVYRPDNITLHVYCSAANLTSLPLDLPPLPKSYVRYKLDFSNNKLLRRLEHRSYFVNTSILDVSNCRLTEVDTKVLKDVSRFRVVNLRQNMLDCFPKDADTVNISARLLIGSNPWKCSCDNSWMIGWLQSLSYQISDPGDVICQSPPRMYGRNVLKSTKEDFCIDPAKRYQTIIISLAAAVATAVLLIIAGLLLYKFRVKFYKNWKFHPFDRDECVGEDMDYDVFLSCSSEDEIPHGRRIVELIESKGYRVCYHERDFLPGQLILDNIGQSIERSKRTVCLLSTNFLNR